MQSFEELNVNLPECVREYPTEKLERLSERALRQTADALIEQAILPFLGKTFFEELSQVNFTSLNFNGFSGFSRFDCALRNAFEEHMRSIDCTVSWMSDGGVLEGSVIPPRHDLNEKVCAFLRSIGPTLDPGDEGNNQLLEERLATIITRHLAVAEATNEMLEKPPAELEIDRIVPKVERFLLGLQGMGNDITGPLVIQKFDPEELSYPFYEMQEVKNGDTVNSFQLHTKPISNEPGVVLYADSNEFRSPFDMARHFERLIDHQLIIRDN